MKSTLYRFRGALAAIALASLAAASYLTATPRPADAQQSLFREGLVNTSDTQNLPMFGVAQVLTLNTAGVVGRYFVSNCTVAGAVTVQFPDATTLVVPLVVGWNLFKMNVSKYTATTATCSYYDNLK